MFIYIFLRTIQSNAKKIKYLIHRSSTATPVLSRPGSNVNERTIYTPQISWLWASPSNVVWCLVQNTQYLMGVFYKGNTVNIFKASPTGQLKLKMEEILVKTDNNESCLSMSTCLLRKYESESWRCLLKLTS